MRRDHCGNCEYMADGECRRLPPVTTPVLIDNQNWRYDYFTNYPQVQHHTPCCGEFRPSATVDPRVEYGKR